MTDRIDAPSCPPCGECGAAMVLRRGAPAGVQPHLFWGCSRFPACRGSHSAHQETGKPMGTPADAETRAARRRAHAAFDTLWLDGGMTRTDAYAWMRRRMGLASDDAHIGKMTKEQCETLIAKCDLWRTDPDGELLDEVCDD